MSGIFFDIEDAIITRLQAKLATLDKVPKVYPAVDLTNIRDKSQAALSVFVAYNGISNVEKLPNAAHIMTLSNEFIVWTVSKSASRHGSQQGTRENADPVLEGIIKALAGWRPAATLPALEMVATPGPAYGEDGFGYFPLVFQMKRQVRGDVT